MGDPMRSLPITVLAAALFVASPAVAESEQPEGEKPSNEGIASPETPRRAPLQSSATSAGPAEPTQYLVQFTGDNGATVTIDGESCTVPCRLVAVPGRHEVRVSGASYFERQVEFPAASSYVTVECWRPGRAALGAVGVAAGSTVAGLGIWAAAAGIVGWDKDNPCNNSSSTFCSDTGYVFGRALQVGVGIVMAAAGLTVASVLGGVGLGRMGKDRVDLGAPERSSREKQPSLRLAGLAAAPVRGGALLGATFVF
jgi:hypothetical protein